MIRLCVAILALGILRPSFAVPGRSFVIVVSGGSGSGKTHSSMALLDALGREHSTLLSMDDYYAPERQPEEFYSNGQINFDHPSAVNVRKFAEHLRYLKSGFPVTIKKYDFGREVPGAFVTIEPRNYILVEGIFALLPEIQALADFRIFVDENAETRFRRRFGRDLVERAGDEAAIRSYFDSTVEPMHQKYIQPSALFADVVIGSPDEPEQLATMVSSIRNLAERTRATKFDVLSQSYSDVMHDLTAASEPSFRVVPFDKLFATQDEFGFLTASRKSDRIDEMIRASALEFDLPSRLGAYLRKHPIKVVERGGNYFIVDRHHLAIALNRRGITQFYVQVGALPSDFDPARFVYINDPGERLTLAQLKNNSYRSLISLVRRKGHLQKSKKPHAELDWARYFAQGLLHLGFPPLNDDTLLDPDRCSEVIAAAGWLSHLPEAADLPGYLSRQIETCEAKVIASEE